MIYWLQLVLWWLFRIRVRRRGYVAITDGRPVRWGERDRAPRKKRWYLKAVTCLGPAFVGSDELPVASASDERNSPTATPVAEFKYGQWLRDGSWGFGWKSREQESRDWHNEVAWPPLRWWS